MGLRPGLVIYIKIRNWGRHLVPCSAETQRTEGRWVPCMYSSGFSPESLGPSSCHRIWGYEFST